MLAALGRGVERSNLANRADPLIRPLRIGLTGGIGCGKSTAAAMFAEFGAPVVDLDEICHLLLAPGQPAQQQVLQAFGKKLIAEDNSIDRNQLRKIVFEDAKSRKHLEQILHGPAFEEMQRRCTELSATYCILCIPLLVETKAIDQVDRVLVLNCRRELQIERATNRDGVRSREIEKIISIQADPGHRLSFADDVLDNNGDRANLHEQVARLHQLYLELASGMPRPETK